MKSANRVIFNTSILYTQLIISLIIGLFSTRLVLDALGETDYGIYMLVAGVIGLLGVLKSNMSSTSMRYMAHSLGSADKKYILSTFNTTIFIHLIIGGLLVFIMELGGLFMFKYILNIPPDKVFDAKVIFQFMILTTFITVISVPYDAVINAHEDIFLLSIVDVLGMLLRLGVAFFLTYTLSNKLIMYGFLIMMVQVVMRIIKQGYSSRKYDECKIKFKENVNKKMIKSILSFTGWNLFGSIGGMFVTSVRGIIINMFFGVKLNAAEGISKKASSQVNMIAVSMTRALKPQLVKSEGGGDRKRMLRITEIGTKYTTILFAVFAVPVILESNYLLTLWLKDVPEYAVVFVQLSIIAMFIEKLSFSLTDAFRAMGDIKLFQLSETLLRFLNIPLALLVFKQGADPPAIYFIAILISIIVFVERLYFAKRLIHVKIRDYLISAVFPIFLPLAVSSCISLLFYLNMSQGIKRLLLVSITYIFSLIVIFWKFSMSKEEKKTFENILKSIIMRIKLTKKEAN